MENSSTQVIKRSSDFLLIKKNGKRHWPSKWLLFNFIKSSEGGLRFGVTASRKTGPAVVRNKLKRWCREYFRTSIEASNSFEADINIIFKPMDPNFYKGLSHSEFQKTMDRGLQVVRNSL